MPRECVFGAKNYRIIRYGGLHKTDVFYLFLDNKRERSESNSCKSKLASIVCCCWSCIYCQIIRLIRYLFCCKGTTKWLEEGANDKPYSDNAAQVRQNHPLKLMAECESEELLDHPLVQQLMKHKWSSYGRPVFWFSLMIYLAFLIPFTYCVIVAKPPYFPEGETDFCNNSRRKAYTWWVFEEGIPAWVLAASIFLGINIIKEVTFEQRR